MVGRAEEQANIAAVYEKLSANESAPHQTRSAFNRKANLHRILARLIASLPAERAEAADDKDTESEPEALLAFLLQRAAPRYPQLELSLPPVRPLPC